MQIFVSLCDVCFMSQHSYWPAEIKKHPPSNIWQFLNVYLLQYLTFYITSSESLSTDSKFF